ncbi:uncharacterized protein LAESUDRAFT_716819 [Laetiporus sulphureus 93-53]|uniref:SH3 domain-containing protein n=1 Tax=Laetiporus sulphureus 93-53 TaxID=1314785 RepID=A0A165CDP2_9APHY|nr:uncharacterized protein LAESUDRAFT_716819 [Laetiporus sulphureus 93-53]KZT02623.1 hypothetical protein LAESUDRAFT_716819 [Laetiporus sulphureus 93-53]
MAPNAYVTITTPSTETNAHVYSRATSPLISDHTQLAGALLAIVIAAGGALWLSIYYFRKSWAAKKERDGLQLPALPEITINSHDAKPLRQKAVSRAQLTASVVMPDRAILVKDAPRVQMTEQAGPSTPGPSDFLAPPAVRISRRVSVPSGPPSRSSTTRRVSTVSFSVPPGTGTGNSSMRNSTYSTVSFSVPPGTGTVNSSMRNSTYSTNSSVSYFDESHKRKVRQVFAAELPDELQLSLGEQLVVVQTFNDGWCVVGRESRTRSGDIELGVVPGCVFARFIEGVRVTRPPRSSSFGVSVTLDCPGGPSFEWSNK